jgi:maltose alpha-D-glucosyltransferase/alpha-amylase
MNDWYKDAVIYEAHVRAFFDSNNDGIGDFPGLTSKLDYLQGLGVNALWLLPFYPSPLRDDGYDIADYENIHPSYGTIQDFERFMDEAHKRGIRVITELVVNHTSDQHPWFQAARRAPAGSPEREFYVWSDTKQRYQGVRIIFTDTETSNWSWDDTAHAYYWHRFFHHQPDLNFDNPHVLEAVLKTMNFWMDRGVDGLRLDAVPYLIEREGTICENLDETHDILKKIRRAMDARYDGRMLIAEANQWPADVRPYFGDGDECQMAFHFPLMPRMFMAIRQEDRHPITEIMRQTPDIPENSQWGLFLRNHDELTLEMVTDEERDYMYQAYAADPRMRINVGIRRRLAPLVENSRRRIELLHSLLFSFPGTPVIYYGDEIGMGDNIYLGDRNGVRTPMQWTGDRNAGFSRANPQRLFAPPIMDPVYGYQSINVEAQEQSAYSLLNWMKRMIALRKQFKVFGRGTLEFIPSTNRKILSYLRRHEEETILCVANLSRTVQPVELNLAQFKGMTPVEMLGPTEFPRIGELPYFLTLPGYNFYWFRLQQAPSPIATQRVTETAAPIDNLPAFFMGVAWDTLLEGNVRTLIERESLGPFLQRQRWFAGKARVLRAARFLDWGVVRKGPDPLFLTIVEAEYEDGGRERYCLPLALVSGSAIDALLADMPQAVIARLTGARKGIVIDAGTSRAAGQALIEAFDQEQTVRTKRGVARARRTPQYDEVRGTAAPLTPHRLGAEQSNTSLRFGDRLVVKLFRRLHAGPNPEVEIGEHFTARAQFTRAPRLAAYLEYEAAGETPVHLGVAQELLRSQSDGWNHALAELGRFYEEVEHRGAPPADLAVTGRLFETAAAATPPLMCELAGSYIDSATMLGRRTAEMHLALSMDTSSEAFAPAPFTRDDLAALGADALRQAKRAQALLETHLETLPAESRDTARGLVEQAIESLRAVHASDAGRPSEFTATRIRVHGDYHLGQVLWSESDYFILDFEGEPERSLDERRHKESPLKDVAGMLRSYSYAAYAALLKRPAGVERLDEWASLWQRWVSAAFLRGYVGVTGAITLLPQDPVQRARLLDLFMIDKALYELNYELNNRPDWVRIPLKGLSELL